jgi:hypothetical protein
MNLKHSEGGIDSLWAEIYRLRAALAEIRDYDKNSKYREGICPYGCDCPNIANLALKDKGTTNSNTETRKHRT